MFAFPQFSPHSAAQGSSGRTWDCAGSCLFDSAAWLTGSVLCHMFHRPGLHQQTQDSAQGKDILSDYIKMEPACLSGSTVQDLVYDRKYIIPGVIIWHC